MKTSLKALFEPKLALDQKEFRQNLATWLI